jgi:hypothetical protein
MASNYDWVMQQSPTERRCFYLRCSDEYAGIQTAATKAYFDKIHAVPKVAFAKFLLERDVSNFNPKAIPNTKYAQIQVEHSLSPELQFWNATLKTGELRLQMDVRYHPTGAFFDERTKIHNIIQVEGIMCALKPRDRCAIKQESQVVEFAEKKIMKRYVHDAFVKWFRGRKMRGNPVGEIEFWSALQKVCDFSPWRPRHDHRFFQRSHCVQFPTLKQCRERFREVNGHGKWIFDGDYEKGSENDTAPTPPSKKRRID